MMVAQIFLSIMILVFWLIGWKKKGEGKHKMGHFWLFLGDSQLTVLAVLFGSWLFIGFALGFTLWELYNFIKEPDVT